MKELGLIEDYFIKLHRNFGISELSFKNQKVEFSEKDLRQLVFMTEAFNEEFENLLDHCNLIYDEIEKSFSLKIRKDINNHYLVNLL